MRLFDRAGAAHGAEYRYIVTKTTDLKQVKFDCVRSVIFSVYTFSCGIFEDDRYPPTKLQAKKHPPEYK